MAEPAPASEVKLRSYQREMVDSFEKNLHEGKHPWLGIASPMQTGKSYLIGPLLQRMEQVLKIKPRVWILSSARVITDQILSDMIEQDFPEAVGRYDGVHKDLKRVTVASIPALQRALAELPAEAGPQVVVMDEAYFTQTPSVRKILAHFGLGEIQKQGRRTRVLPKAGKGWVVGFSGTGMGLEYYQPSGSLDLLTAIQEKYIRPMIGERVFPRGRTREVKGGLEGMIWWLAREANANLLAALYLERIDVPGYRRNLIFVPTIRHAELLQEAL